MQGQGQGQVQARKEREREREKEKELTPAQIQRAQDKESKRARGALSCAECRRLKLKCDKTVPCSSCKRRGCSAICPNGSLTTGQGTRFVLADTEKLHQKIAAMSDRIRQLEDALAILHSTQTRDAHPLLSRDLLRIKSIIELHAAAGEVLDDGSPSSAAAGGAGAGGGGRGAGAGGGDGGRRGEEGEEESQAIDAFGTLAIRDDGAATFYGRSAGQESLLIGEAAASSSSSSPTTTTPSSFPSTTEPQTWTTNTNTNTHPTLPRGIQALASSFPFGPSSSCSYTHTHDPPLDFHILTKTYVPPWSEAQRLCASYLEQAPWFFGAVTRRQLEEEILPAWYTEACPSPPPLPSSHPHPHPPSAPAPALPFASTPPQQQQHHHQQHHQQQQQHHHHQQQQQQPHDLALLFILLAFGALTDATADASTYYTLTKTALGLAPVLERPPSVATVQTLALMAIYEGVQGGENAIEATWGLMGIATKLAQSIGLHRDCARWSLPPAEVQKRRALFWELFITDCWQSLATGRLATFSLPFVDCELPFDPDQTMTDDGAIQPSFPYWKARFGAECVAGVVQGTLTSRAPKYSIILELDRKVRDMELPAYAQGPPPQGAGLAQTMSHFMPINYRELTLLYIHRCFFAHAISSNSADPIRSQYAPSFLAGYRSACTIIASVSQQFRLFPAQIARFWVLWTHAFSAAVMLASVVTHSSRSKVAPAALLELRTACELFEQASAYGGRSTKFLPILQRLHRKAQTVFMDTNNGVPPSVPGDIFRPTPPGGEQNDELSIFSGKTHTLTTKAAPRVRPTTASTTASSSSPSSSSSSAPGASDSPGYAFVPVDNPSFANVHPSLVRELRGFDGHIAAQIREAYGPSASASGGPGFASRMEVSSQQYRREYVARCHQQQMQMEAVQREKERAERDELERRRQMEMEVEQQQQRLFREQKEEEERRRREVSEREDEYYRQRAVREAQRQTELERQRQQQSLQYVQQQQTRQQQFEQQYEDEHYAEQHTFVVTDTHPTSSHSLNQMELAYEQPERPTQPSQQQSMYPMPSEFPHQQLAPHQQPVLSTPHYVDPEQPYNSAHSVTVTRPHMPRQVSDHRPAVASDEMEYTQQQQYTDHAQLQGHVPQKQQTHYYPTYQTTTPHGVPYSSVVDPVTQLYGVYGHLRQQHGQHYTPDGVLRGIAADDTSLQETWQSYMYKVGSPRQFLED